MEKMLMLGTSLNSIEMIDYARSQGIYTIVTDYLPPEKSRAKLAADEYWMINTSELDLLEKKCREEGVTSVVCGISEFNLEMAMELCRRIGLPNYCTPEAWSFSRDKEKFKTLCKGIGAPVATDYHVSFPPTEEELDAVKFPVVVKPVDLSGNRGISYCYDKEELCEAIDYARSCSKNPKLVVERMLKGREWYSYYAMAEGEIRLIGLNAMISEPGELKNLYSLTTTVTDKVDRFITEINPKIEEVLKAVGCKEGIAWVQVMLDEDDKFYIIEMGYRLPGDLPHLQYPDMFGFDSLKWIVDLHRGIPNKVSDLPPALLHAPENCGCSYSLWTNKEGTLASFEGLDTLLATGDYKFYTLYQEGDHFARHRPVGVLVFTGKDADEICSHIDKINSTLRVFDTEGDDVMIKYTDFPFLREIYTKGQEEAVAAATHSEGNNKQD
ncbi:MAG: ATP-grasp domain-containing protein [Bacteroidales bacterium]|nr:ATP-grasp domain-containing protein [Bacteroidales bacterium]